MLAVLFAEIDELVSDGIDVEGRLYVSDRAHLVMPYHKLIDSQSSASKEIGTTGRGIGPAYEDKYGRRGIRVLDLRNPERLKKLIERGVYPFVVPFRPLADSLAIRDGATPPQADTVADVTERVAELLLAADMSGADQEAGCAACGACSLLSAAGA